MDDDTAVQVPVLTWHQLTEDVSGSATISPETFRKQIQALSDRNDFVEDCIAEMAAVVYGE